MSTRRRQQHNADREVSAQVRLIRDHLELGDCKSAVDALLYAEPYAGQAKRKMYDLRRLVVAQCVRTAPHQGVRKTRGERGELLDLTGPRRRRR